jgi:hypothetical protein
MLPLPLVQQITSKNRLIQILKVVQTFINKSEESYISAIDNRVSKYQQSILKRKRKAKKIHATTRQTCLLNIINENENR